jgi:hypothetical protein
MSFALVVHQSPPKILYFLEVEQLVLAALRSCERGTGLRRGLCNHMVAIGGLSLSRHRVRILLCTLKPLLYWAKVFCVF